MRTPALFGAKNFEFLRNERFVRTDKGGKGIEPVRGGGGGCQFFASLCGRPLKTPPLPLFCIFCSLFT